MTETKRERAQMAGHGWTLGNVVAAHVLKLYARGNLRNEEDLTAGLCSALIADWPDLSGPHEIDVSISHKINEEPHLGADLMIVFKSHIPEWKISTRTLVQAKRAEPDELMRRSEWGRMQRQMKVMLAHMNESFALVYSMHDGVVAFPALSVASCESRDLFDLDGYSFPDFIRGIFQGLIGQQPLGAAPEGRSWAHHEISILVSRNQRNNGRQPEPSPAPEKPVYVALPSLPSDEEETLERMQRLAAGHRGEALESGAG